MIVYAPYLISIAITLLYATEGKLSSGESFDKNKFIGTLVVQIVAMLSIGLAGYPEITALLPSLVTVLVTKAYSYFKKKHKGLI